MEFQSRYKTKKGPQVFCPPEESLTQQNQKDDCDINHIMKKYEQTGALPTMIKQEPKYGDYSDVKSYQEALNIVHHATEQFESLDAHIRKKFNNDASQFLEFATNPENKKEMKEMGLLKQGEETTPPKQPESKEKPVIPPT